MDSQVDKLQTLVGRRLNGGRYHTDSATSSVYSYTSLSPNRSIYASSIEKQLQSLLGDDNQHDTTRVLQQTFDQQEAESGNRSCRNSLMRSPISSETLTHLQDKEDDEQSKKYADGKCSIQDFSAFILPFKEKPAVVVGRNMDYYIPSPTSVRNYLDHPDPAILKSMQLPYPFRVKEPVSQRMNRMKSASRRKEPMRKSKRHSLALGQVQHDESVSLDQNYTNQTSPQDIMTWVPDHATVWTNWMQEDPLTHAYNNNYHPFEQ